MKKSININLIYGIVIIAIAISSLLVGCEKQTSEEKYRDPKELSEDKTFISLTIDMRDFVNLLTETVKAKSLSIYSVHSQLLELKNQNKTSQEQLIKIDKIFKTTISNKINEHMLFFSENWQIIKNKYGPISQEILEKECLEVLKLDRGSKSNSNVSIKTMVADCGWRFSVCVGAATAGAILCHAGCDTTALALTAGLGIPACVALCGTGQVMAGVACYDNYCSIK